jgi:hypothetical protein
VTRRKHLPVEYQYPSCHRKVTQVATISQRVYCALPLAPPSDQLRPQLSSRKPRPQALVRSACVYRIGPRSRGYHDRVAVSTSPGLYPELTKVLTQLTVSEELLLFKLHQTRLEHISRNGIDIPLTPIPGVAPSNAEVPPDIQTLTTEELFQLFATDDVSADSRPSSATPLFPDLTVPVKQVTSPVPPPLSETPPEPAMRVAPVGIELTRSIEVPQPNTAPVPPLASTDTGLSVASPQVYEVPEIPVPIASLTDVRAEPIPENPSTVQEQWPPVTTSDHLGSVSLKRNYDFFAELDEKLAGLSHKEAPTSAE